MKLCPKCLWNHLRIRTDLPNRLGWLSCATCGYMEKDDGKQGITKKTGERNCEKTLDRSDDQ